MKNFYRDAGLVISVIALIIVTICISAIVFNFSPNAFWLSVPFLVLSAGFAIGKLIIVTRKTFQYFMHIDSEIDSINQISVYNYPVAVAIVDNKDKLVWFNAVFEEKFPEESVFGKEINIITSRSVKKIMEKENTQIKYKDRYYMICAHSPQEKDAQDVFILYFNDISREKYMERQLRLTRPVVIFFMIDGYEEIFNGNAESETSRITAEVDALIEQFAKGMKGIVHKNRHDKFWAVIEQQYVIKILNENVKILESARKIQVGELTNITLSIGIGTTAADIEESERFARQALEMALDRGGDQAIVKTPGGFKSFGGDSKGIETKTNVEARRNANALLNLINTSDKIYIMGHQNSDFDSIGASVGLTGAIRNMGKNAFAVINTEKTLGIRLIEHVKSSESGGNSIFAAPAAANAAITPDSLLIIVDTNNPQILDSKELYKKANKIAVIDHHRKADKQEKCINNAMLFYLDTSASSASELISEMLFYFGDAGKLAPAYAEALLAGIMLDTKNFTLKTGVRTFKAAAVLKNLKADTVNVKKMFSTSLDSYNQKSKLVGEAVIYKKCAISLSETGGNDIRIIASQAADELLGITGVIASFVIYPISDSDIMISARSMGAVNVQLVMEQLGGGGHHTMSGAMIKNTSLNVAKGMLTCAIDSYFEKHK